MPPKSPSPYSPTPQSPTPLPSPHRLLPCPIPPIAHIRSCYPERFGIPRQAGLVPTATAQIIFPSTEATKLSLRGIDQFSHLWVIFWFHQGFDQVKPLVQPPRLGGRKTMGLYATRSPNRPNPIGLSAVALDRIEFTAQEIRLHIRGADILDGTPVLDVKPYVAYADAIPSASGWATADQPLPVRWCDAAVLALEEQWAMGCDRDPNATRQLIEETIGQDPRPAHERGKDGKPNQEWNMRVARWDVVWRVESGLAWVTQLVKLP